MKEFILKDKKTRMRYHDFPGKEMPILFIHGLGCAGSFDYPEVAAQEELAGHRKIIVDLLGSGFSDKPDDFEYSVKAHAEYLSDFVEFLGLERLIIFAHSLGGAVGITLANLCKDKVHRLILSEANLDKGGGFTSKAIAEYEMNDFIKEGFQEIIARSKKHSSEIWTGSFSVCSPKAMYLISKSAIEGDTPSWRALLYSLNCLRTFIFGEESLPDPDMQVLAEEGIHIEVVKNAGHSMAWENPKGLAEAIRNGMYRRE